MMYKKLEDYFIVNEEETKEKTIDDIDDLYLLLDFLNRWIFTIGKNKWIFRGQSNEINNGFKEWKLESSLNREVKRRSPQDRKINLNDITEKMMEHINKSSFLNKNILEVLSEMQHYGNPTPLIDFTFDILQALWFGFYSDNFNSEKKGYVTLYLKEINNSEIKYEIGKIKNCVNSFPLQCSNTINRGISQRSIFILDNEENYFEFLKKFKKINVNYKLKNDILKFLKSKNIESKYVFPDNKGLYMDFFDKILILLSSSPKDDTPSKYTLSKNGDEKREKLNYSDAGMYYNQGNSLMEDGKFIEACEKYEKAINIRPDYSHAYYNWGSSLKSLKRFDEACEKYEKVVSINPNDSGAYYNWGNILLSDLKRFDEACEKYEKAINTKPDYSHAYYNWGISLMGMEKFKDAANKFEKVIDITKGKKDFGAKNWLKKIKEMID